MLRTDIQWHLDAEVRDNEIGTPVLFLHGLGLDRQQWEGELSFFAGKRPAAAISLPGHGHSPRGRSRLTIACLAEAVIDWLDEQEWTTAHLVGCSLGGIIAWQIAEKSEERCASIVTFGAAPRLRYPDFIVKPSAWLLDWWLAGFRPEKYAAIAAKGASKDEATQQRLKVAFWRAATQNRLSTYELRRAIAHYDYTAHLASTAIPTLMIRAQDDQAVNKVIDRTQPIWQDNPQVRVTSMDYAGHVANWDRPEAFLAILHHRLGQVDETSNL